MKISLTSWSDAIRQREFGMIADWFIQYFVVVGAVGLLMAGIAAGFDRDQKAGAGIRVFVLSLLLAAACAVSGWLLGLLFGIPRSLARGNGNRAATSDTSTQQIAAGAGTTSSVNTNLEDISDWLTKTLVGVGLTQFYSFPPFIWHIAGLLNEQGIGWTNHGRLLVLALFFYFTPGGFWLGYVGTRTILTELFNLVGVDPQSVSAASNPNNLQIDSKQETIRPGGSNVADADRVLLNTPLHLLKTPQELAAWGSAQARADNLSAAQTALESALGSDPDNQDVKQQLAKVYFALGKYSDAAHLLQNTEPTSFALLNALYVPAPDGFRLAIDIGEKLLKKRGAEKDADLHVWLACAYGQKYKYLKEQAPTSPELSQIRARVVAEIKAALEIDPTWRAALRSFWKPEPGSSEDDLSGFDPNDPDLSPLLESSAIS
jgi:hypothetical protein